MHMPRLEGHVFSSDMSMTSEGVNLGDGQTMRVADEHAHAEDIGVDGQCST